jgi:hypothetical protein
MRRAKKIALLIFIGGKYMDELQGAIDFCKGKIKALENARRPLPFEKKDPGKIARITKKLSRYEYILTVLLTKKADEILEMKQIFIVNAKLKLANGREESIPFHVEDDNCKQAERKLIEWLENGLSGFKFTEILFVETEKNIYVVS